MLKISRLRHLAQNWKNQPRDQRGRWVRAAVNFARKNPGLVKDGIVNAGGVVGSIVGDAIAGTPGKLVGDLLGAATARKAVQDIESTYTAYQRLKKNEAFQAARRLEQLKKLRAEAIAELEERKKSGEIEKEQMDDFLGWAIGNASAEALDSTITALAGVPLKGSVVAIKTVPYLSPKAIKLKHRLAKKYARRTKD